jgi:hypothetical protein
VALLWGEGLGNLPGFRVQGAAASEKEPTGGENGEGERGVTSRPAPPPPAGAVCGHTSADASAAVLTSGETRDRVARPLAGFVTAGDFFTVPTLTFRVLYCFFVIEHGRRKIPCGEKTRTSCNCGTLDGLET